LLTEKFRFGAYTHLIFPNELEVKDTTDIQKSASYLDLHLQIDTGRRMKTKLFDKHAKRDGLIFPIINFPFITTM